LSTEPFAVGSSRGQRGERIRGNLFQFTSATSSLIENYAVTQINAKQPRRLIEVKKEKNLEMMKVSSRSRKFIRFDFFFSSRFVCGVAFLDRLARHMLGGSAGVREREGTASASLF
jgi:hypothetical protein